MRQTLLKICIFLLPVILLILNFDRIAFHPGSVYSDLTISHYPNALFLKRIILTEHVMPLWSPQILSGYPFGANPLSGVYYLPGWLGLLFPLIQGFNLMVVLHIIWGGAGLYFYLKSNGTGEIPALFGVLIFEGMPKLFAHLGAGHISLIYAVSWTPWLILVDRYAEKEQPFSRILYPGIILSIIFMADVRWAVYSGVLWLAIVVWRIGTDKFQTIKKWFMGVTRVFINFLTFLILSSPLLLPLLEYMNLSTRRYLSGEETLINSLPPAQLLGLMYPYIRGPAEWILYPGAITLILFFVGLLNFPKIEKVGFWYLTVITTLILAMGSFLPFGDRFAGLPILSLLRVPPRVLFLTHLAFSIIAAQVFSNLFSGMSQNPYRLSISKKFLFYLLLFGFFSLLFGLAITIFINQPVIRLQFMWGGLWIFLSVICAVLILFGKLPRRSGSFALFFLAVVDLSLVNLFNLEFRPQQNVLSDRSDVAYLIKEMGGSQPFRVYSPSYSIPQQVSMIYNLELADGVDPLILGNYQDFMEKATGVASVGYSVTLPPFKDDPTTDNHDAVPDADLLGLLNVKYVVSEFELSVDDLVFVRKVGSTWVYENRAVMPRAWIQSPQEKIGQEITPVDVVRINVNHLKLSVKGPGLLILSEIMYPGWSVSVNGRPDEIKTVVGLFRGIVLNPGIHEVEFVFKPLSVTLGWVIGGCGWFIISLLGIKIVAEKRREYFKK